MLSKKIEKAFNIHLNAEVYSAYLYLQMAAHFESLNLKGFAHWMKIQFQEELAHAMRFFTFIHDRRGKVVLDVIAAPPAKWASPLAVFQATYKHECKVSGLINKLVDLAIAESDHAANIFLQWFVTEQVEEEAAASEVLDRLKLIGDSGEALLMLDGEMGQRPAPASLDPAAQGEPGA